MAIEILPSGQRHDITAAEVFATIEYPLYRYAVVTDGLEHLNSYMFIGRIDNEPVIEVGANDEDDDWVVFHAMLLTRRIANDIYEMSGGDVDYRADVAPNQRR